MNRRGKRFLDHRANSDDRTTSGMSSTSEIECPPSPAKQGRVRSISETGESVSGAGTSSSVSTPGLENRRPGRKSSRQIITDTEITEDVNSLYYIVRNSADAIPVIVEDWITTYKQNRETALLSLIQFFINASGCKSLITLQMLQEMEHTAIIKKITDELDEDSAEFTLVKARRKKFEINFCEFIQTLMKKCQYSIIYDKYLMENVISMLTGLTESAVRAFRQTATFAAMKLMTALVDVLLLISENCDNSLKQYQAERERTRDGEISQRLRLLVDQRSELMENSDEVKSMLTYMFKNIFAHRYRDFSHKIRAITILELGLWMQMWPEHYVDDEYLKYIGWTLHDQIGAVRLQCLQTLIPLYANEELKEKLQLFTIKFIDRIVAMTNDFVSDVSVQALKIVTTMIKTHKYLFTDKHNEHLFGMVFTTNQAVARAAGKYLSLTEFQLDQNEPEITTNSGKIRLPNTPLIRILVQFFIEAECPEHAAYLVDSLIEINPIMKDWECMTDLLIEEPGPLEEEFDNEYETGLIKIMVCCVKQAATGEPPAGRSSTRNKNYRGEKQIEDDKQKLSEHFICTLPILLQRFGVDSEKLENLLEIPQYLTLNIYDTSNFRPKLQELLIPLKDILMNNTENNVLMKCSKTLEILCNEDISIYAKCDKVRSTVTDHWVKCYKQDIEKWQKQYSISGNPDEDEMFRLVHSLKKITILYCCHNLNPWNIWPVLYLEKWMPKDAFKYSLEANYFSLKWGLVDIENSNREQLQGENIELLRTRFKSFLGICGDIVNTSKDQDLKEDAYSYMCDLLIVFSKELDHESNKEFKKLMSSVLNYFLESYVFIPLEESSTEVFNEAKSKALNKRRTFLAGFCKLITYNVIPTHLATDVFKHYDKYYENYGDLIKLTIGEAMVSSRVNCAMTMCLSLSKSFKDLHSSLSRGTTVPRDNKELADLKELAKRFALSFSADEVLRNREAITALHRAGISFAFNAENALLSTGPPPYLKFLYILSEMSHKLLKEDKKVVCAYLDRRKGGYTFRTGAEWKPLTMYRKTLGK